MMERTRSIQFVIVVIRGWMSLPKALQSCRMSDIREIRFRNGIIVIVLVLISIQTSIICMN